MSSDYVVAIPSYKREEIINEKTLKMLKDGGVKASRIFIFVANEAERKIYEKTVHKELYGKLVVGKLGITKQRKFIVQYFAEGKYVISIDDDVEAVEEMVDSKKLKRVKNLDSLFRRAYKDLKKHHLYMWGVYPVHNPMFMSKVAAKSTNELKLIIGGMRGFIVRHSKHLFPKAEEKEDYEESILYYLEDGGVLRYNHLTIKTRNHSEGGLGTNRQSVNKRSAKYLSKKYPDFITIFQRKDGMTEVKLARGFLKKNQTKRNKGKGNEGNNKTRKN